MPIGSRLKTATATCLRNLHRRLLVGAVLVGALASPARAHVTLSPAFVEAGVPARVVFEAPNEREGRATMSLRIEAPAGVELARAAPPPGWELTLTDRVATWTGGRITGTRVVSFPLEVTAHTRAGTETFRAVQRYDDGEDVRWEAPLTVVPAADGSAPSQHLGRALAAGAAGLGVIAISLLLLWRTRRRSLQER
jgi:uncharacterized protein YcnI